MANDNTVSILPRYMSALIKNNRGGGGGDKKGDTSNGSSKRHEVPRKAHGVGTSETIISISVPSFSYCNRRIFRMSKKKDSYCSICEIAYVTKNRHTARAVSYTLVYMHGFVCCKILYFQPNKLRGKIRN